jgi:hypothetical protein
MDSMTALEHGDYAARRALRNVAPQARLHPGRLRNYG